MHLNVSKLDQEDTTMLKAVATAMMIAISSHGNVVQPALRLHGNSVEMIVVTITIAMGLQHHHGPEVTTTTEATVKVADMAALRAVVRLHGNNVMRTLHRLLPVVSMATADIRAATEILVVAMVDSKLWARPLVSVAGLVVSVLPQG